MKGLKKLLLASAISLGALGLCLWNTTATATAAAATSSDFNCEYTATGTGNLDPYVYYGCTEVNTYTAEEAAAKGIPAGYENEVLEVLGITNRGILVDFSAQQIPFDLVEALEFRVYLGESEANVGTAYPQLRIPKPGALGGSWVLQRNEATPVGEWTTVTVSSTGSNFAALKDEENGILNKFELAVRSKDYIDFYIDSIDCVLKQPVINYSEDQPVYVTLGKKMYVSATAADGLGNALDLQYIWADGVELNEKGTPTQAGEYALTLKAVDSYGGVATKTVTVIVTEEAVEVDSDFQCIYAANPNKMVGATNVGGYGSSAVNTYTAEEAAAKGIPAGYENEVLEVVGIGSSAHSGLLLDFSREEVPLSLLESLDFRVYIGISDKNAGTNYPQLRIPNPDGSGSWVYQKSEALTAGEWINFSIAKNSSFSSLCDENGYLSIFEFALRSQGKVDFYIDSITYVLKADDGQAPVINYAGSDTITVAMGSIMDLAVTATDAMEGELPVEYIWSEGTVLDENGTPTQVGSYTLTFKSVDYFGHTATKTITVNVTEADRTAPVINFNISEIKTMVGAMPMFKVSATDNSGNVTVTKAWSEGALDKKGRLTVGTHTWTITAVDSSGNTATKVVTFIVTESEPAYSFVTDESDIFGDCIVTFDGVDPISVPYGFKIAKPADPVRETTAEAKYKFLGWYLGDKEWDFDTDVVTSDINLVAMWQETKQVYRVTFDGETSSTKVAYGELIPADIIPADPVKAATTMREFIFDGWYLGDKKWDFATDVITGETELEPKFITVVRKYTVTFDGENAQEYEFGSKITEPETPVKEATATHTYEFLGWFNGDRQWNFATDTVSYNTYLQSKWREVEIGGGNDTPTTSEPDETPTTSDDSSDTAQPGMADLLAGCTSVIGGVASGVVAISAAAYVLLKKKED